jgi:hypothetical protein
MNKHLKSVKDLLVAKQGSLKAKLQAGISDDVKKSVEEALAGIEKGLADLETAEQEATIEQLTALFTEAIDKLAKAGQVTEVEMASMQKTMEANLGKLQAQISKGGNSAKKFKASMSLKRIKKSSDYQPYSAGVDVTDWTPEAEVEMVESFRPLVGVMGGFNIGTTGKPSLKVRKLTATGTAMVVANHSPKPLIELVGSQNVVNAQTIAGIIEGVADEDLEDNAGLESEIRFEALEELSQAENVSAVALLEASGQAFANDNFGTVAYADLKTAIVAVVDQVKQALGNRKSEIALAMNTSTWAKLKDLRNENGTPISIESIIGDVIALEDNTITDDNFYCWAKKYVNFKVYKTSEAEWYKGVKVVTDEDDAITAIYSEWRTDEQSIRVRERGMMYVSDTSVVVKGSLGDVVTEITEVVIP